MVPVFPAIPDSVPAQAADNIDRVPVYDFARGAFAVVDGALQECNGRDAVRQWIDLMLRQQPGKVPIYRTGGDTHPGIDRSLLGERRLPSGMAAAEIERGVRDTMAFCPAIRSVDAVTVTRERRTATVAFTVYLHNGDSLEVEHIVDE